MSGLFITFEGPEGAGKSTNLNYLADILKAKGIPVLITREPGGTPLGEEIRDLLLDPSFKGMSPSTELLLMFAARSEHLEHVILPARSAGKVVICDRFTDSSYAYQGGGRGINSNKIAQLEYIVQDTFRPDITLLFDVEPRVGLSRILKRSGLDRFEQEGLEFFEAVRAAYKQQAHRSPERYRLIDANKSLTDVQVQLLDVVEEILEYLGVS